VGNGLNLERYSAHAISFVKKLFRKIPIPFSECPLSAAKAGRGKMENRGRRGTLFSRSRGTRSLRLPYLEARQTQAIRFAGSASRSSEESEDLQTMATAFGVLGQAQGWSYPIAV